MYLQQKTTYTKNINAIKIVLKPPVLFVICQKIELKLQYSNLYFQCLPINNILVLDILSNKSQYFYQNNIKIDLLYYRLYVNLNNPKKQLKSLYF